MAKITASHPGAIDMHRRLTPSPFASRLSMPALALLLVLVCQACSVTSRPVQPADLGHGSSLAAMEANLDLPGPIELETIASADWQVSLGGLLNLDADAARQAGLQDRDEPIQIYAHLLRHPQYGKFLVDTGVSRRLLADPGQFGLNGLVLHFMPLEKMHIRRSTAEILEASKGSLQGVFFTHLHIDHISGMPDIAAAVPLYVGRGEVGARSFSNLFVRGPTDGLLQGRTPLREWAFATGGDEPLSSIVDVFGDGSLYAVNVPGHTPGSTAYIARTTQGPVLLTGDTCHTSWGWTHSVEPGSFTADRSMNRRSLLALKALAERHPGLQVRLGHQALAAAR
jgi:glyoxylase-like metal-dependent hydrolase (beta-lactamase superfamily II)